MFFEVDPENIRKHMDAVRAAREAQEQAREYAEQGEAPAEESGFRILQGLDGGIIIDGPALTKVIEITDEPWTWDMLDKTSMLVQGIGSNPWVPLANIKHYVEGMPPRA
jgi:hypothetical protein